jgi:hypothetical protein
VNQLPRVFPERLRCAAKTRDRDADTPARVVSRVVTLVRHRKQAYKDIYRFGSFGFTRHQDRVSV